MKERRFVDPTSTVVDFEGQRVSLKELASARDHVRASHLTLDPFPVDGIEVRDSNAGDGQFTVRGHASVFNRLSLDLGGFKEKIARGAFTNVLDKTPDVHALWDHDTRWTLARTRNKTLELREDPLGLHTWARIAPTTYAADLRVLMERGDIDQMSFAFTVEKDTWEIDENDEITRTITEVRDLYDVTVTAQGAYPQTDVSLVRSFMKAQVSPSRLPETARAVETVVAERSGGTVEAAASEGMDGSSSHEDVGEDERRRQDRLREVQHRAQARFLEVTRELEERKLWTPK